MESKRIEKVLVVGAGLMGSGIAQVCAQAGLGVTVCDVSSAALERASKAIAWSAGKLVEKGTVKGPLEAIMGRLSFAPEMDGAAGQADLLVEAVFEQLALKREVFASLDRLSSPRALIASNTSALSITELAAATSRPERVLGLHFFSPVPMMEAVEVVRGMATSDESFAAGVAFVEAIGKVPIKVQRDVPGFLINRINLPSNLEAMRLFEAGVGTIEDIDRGMRLATGRRMGPFETGDLVGLDVTHAALLALYEETRDDRWYPPLILRRKVRAGQLGRKAGVGWYRYDKDGNRLGPT